MRPTLPQKFHLAYHLVIGGGQLWTPLLATPTAPEALHGSGQVREAWTDVGKNAVVRRADLRRSDTFSQVSVHLGVDPAFLTTFFRLPTGSPPLAVFAWPLFSWGEPA